MTPLHPQYIVNDKEVREAVVLPIAEWDRIVEELEELDDIRAYDEAKAEPQDSIPFEQAVKDIDDGLAV